jgi:succinyl-CoA synthetase alpha subunit
MQGIKLFTGLVHAFESTDASLIEINPLAAPGAVLEAAEAGIGLIVCITEGIPALDMVRMKAIRKIELLEESGARIVPNPAEIGRTVAAVLSVRP